MLKQFHLHNIDDVKVVKTNSNEYGFGASINNGLMYAWTNSDIVLTTEDDWYVDKKLDITNDVITLMSDPGTCMIRYGSLFTDENSNREWYVNTTPYNSKYLKVYSKYDNHTKMIFNNQIALRHKRIYDKLGYYTKNTTIENNEIELSNRYNKLTKYGRSTTLRVLRPSYLENNGYSNGYVYHIGEISTSNHRFKVDDRFKKYNELCSKTITVRQDISKNIGDFCSNILVQFLSKIKTNRIHLRSKLENNLLAIGSILHHAKKGDVIWGSGSMWDDDRYLEKNIKVRSVRGPLTRNLLLRNGIECPEVYCDPGVLIPYMYLNNKTNLTKEYEIGIIPHVVDYEKVKEQFKDRRDICVIDMNDIPSVVVNNISRCRKTISSSLHGIIISEALDIPCAWVKFSDKILGGEFKFRDYYYGSGRSEADVHCHDFRNFIDIDNVVYVIQSKYDIGGLLDSFPYEIDNRIKSDIERWFGDVKSV